MVGRSSLLPGLAEPPCRAEKEQGRGGEKEGWKKWEEGGRKTRQDICKCRTFENEPSLFLPPSQAEGAARGAGSGRPGVEDPPARRRPVAGSGCREGRGAGRSDDLGAADGGGVRRIGCADRRPRAQAEPRPADRGAADRRISGGRRGGRGGAAGAEPGACGDRDERQPDRACGQPDPRSGLSGVPGRAGGAGSGASGGARRAAADPRSRCPPRGWTGAAGGGGGRIRAGGGGK